jgi:hypothetical protein
VSRSNGSSTSSDGGSIIDAGDASPPPPPRDAAGDAGNACQNPADQAAGSDPMMVSDSARNCGVECFGLPDMSCTAKCMWPQPKKA